MIDQINEDTKLKEFTQWVLDQWVLDTKEVQDKALLTIQEVENGLDRE